MSLETLVAEIIRWLALVVVPLFALYVGLDARRLHLTRLGGVLGRFLLVTHVALPALAIAGALVLPLPADVRAGLVLLALAPPGALAPSRAGRLGDRDLAYAWQATAVLLSFFSIPLTLLVVDALVPRHLALGAGAVSRSLLFAYVAPFALGLALAQRWPHGARRLGRVLGALGAAGQLVLVVLVLILTVPRAGALGAAGMGAIAGFALLNVLLGHLGGRDRASRGALVASLTTRRLGLPLLIAQINLSVVAVAPVLVVYTAFGALLFLFYGAWLLRRRGGVTR